MCLPGSEQRTAGDARVRSTPRRELPGGRWLQIGAAAAGVGIADCRRTGGVAPPIDEPRGLGLKVPGAGTTHRASSQNESTASNDSRPRRRRNGGGGLGRVSAQTMSARVRTGSERPTSSSPGPAVGGAVAVPSVTPSAATGPAAVKVLPPPSHPPRPSRRRRRRPCRAQPGPGLLRRYPAAEHRTWSPGPAGRW